MAAVAPQMKYSRSSPSADGPRHGNGQELPALGGRVEDVDLVVRRGHQELQRHFEGFRDLAAVDLQLERRMHQARRPA